MCFCDCTKNEIKKEVFMHFLQKQAFLANLKLYANKFFYVQKKQTFFYISISQKICFLIKK